MSEDLKYEFAHSGITVSDIESSIEFYKENFGFKEISRKDKPGLEIKLATLKLGEFSLELVELYKPKTTPKMPAYEKSNLIDLIQKSHIALITNDLSTAYNELKNKSIEVISFGKLFFCLDPDKFPIEIRQK